MKDQRSRGEADEPVEPQSWPDPEAQNPDKVSDLAFVREKALRQREIAAKEKHLLQKKLKQIQAAACNRKKVPRLKGTGSKALWRSCSPLRLLREEHGIEQKELARILGIHQTAVSRVEVGMRSLSHIMCARIATILGVSAPALFMSYLEWRAMEPTITKTEINKLAAKSVRASNPVFIRLSEMQVNVSEMANELSRTANIGVATALKIMTDPSSSPSMGTVEKVSRVIGVNPGTLFEELREWKSHFAGLSAADKVVRALEIEMEIQDKDWEPHPEEDFNDGE